LQAYVHAPPEQAGEALATVVVHAVAEPHEPFDWQLSTLAPEQVVWPGAHTPLQAPETHVWFVHAEALLQVPFDWHVSTPLAEQVVCPGAHTPMHAPLTQAWLLHAAAFCHVPVGLQFWGC
jgi:hypothetical protein